MAGIEITSALVARIVEETGGGDALPLMAYTLEQLYQRAMLRDAARITASDYEAIGGVEGALKQRAAALKRDLQREGLEALMVPTLLKLVTIDQESAATKRRLRLDALSSEERRIINAFRDARLVTIGGSGPNAVAFVSHEALFRAWQPFVDAIEAHVDKLRSRSRLERDGREWAEAGRASGYLLAGERLDGALKTLESEPAGWTDVPLITEFVTASRRRRDEAIARDADLLANRIIDDHRKDPERAMLLTRAAVGAYGRRPRLNLAMSYAVQAPGKRLQLNLDAPVRTLALSDDGRSVAIGTDDGKIMLFDDQHDTAIWTAALKNKTAKLPSVGCLAFAATSTRLAAGGGSESLVLLDAKTGERIQRLGLSETVTAVAGSERLIIAGGDKGRVRVWSSEPPFKLIHEINLEEPVGHLAISRYQERFVAATDRDGYVIELGMNFVFGHGDQPKPPRLVISHREEIRSIAISPDDKQSVSAAWDNDAGICIWPIWRSRTDEKDPEISVSPEKIIQTGKYISSVAWTERGIITDAPVELTLWDPKTGESRGPAVAGDTNRCNRFVVRGSRVAAQLSDQQVAVFETAEYVPRLRLRIGTAFSRARIAYDDQLLITRNSGIIEKGKVTVRDAGTGKELHSVLAPGVAYNEMSVSPDGKAVLIIESERIVCRQLPNLSEIFSLSIDGCKHVVFGPGGMNDVITADSAGRVQRWQKSRVRTLARFGEYVLNSIEVSSDGRYGLLEAGGSTVLLDLETKKRLYEEKFEKFKSGRIAIAPDSSCFVIGRDDKLVSRAMDGSLLHTFAWGKYNRRTAWAPVIGFLAFSPDSKRLASASGEGWVYIWDVASGELVQLLRVNDEPMQDMAFSNTGQELVVCTAEFEGEYDSTGYAEIWPTPDFDHVLKLAERRTFRSADEEELAQYGLATTRGSRSASSLYHLNT